MRLLRFGFAPALVCLLAACPDDNAGASGCVSYVNALGAYAERCGVGVNVYARAQARVGVFCSSVARSPGSPNIDQQLGACAQDYANAACGQDLECPMVGELADGAACLDGFQCKSGACSAKDGLCGACIARVAVGGNCESDRECVEKARCITTDGTNGKCVVEQVARLGEECASITSPSDCSEGLRCKSNGTGIYTCQVPGGAGSSCTSRSDCGPDFRCIQSKCAAPLGESASCQSSSDCGPGLGCGVLRTCQKITFVKDGEDCDSARQCETGRCRGLATTTGPYGQPVIEPGKCTTPLADGALCDADGDEECDLLAQCVRGKCTIPDASACK